MCHSARDAFDAPPISRIETARNKLQQSVPAHEVASSLLDRRYARTSSLRAQRSNPVTRPGLASRSVTQRSVAGLLRRYAPFHEPTGVGWAKVQPCPTMRRAHVGQVKRCPTYGSWLLRRYAPFHESTGVGWAKAQPCPTMRRAHVGQVKRCPTYGSWLLRRYAPFHEATGVGWAKAQPCPTMRRAQVGQVKRCPTYGSWPMGIFGPETEARNDAANRPNARRHRHPPG